MFKYCLYKFGLFLLKRLPAPLSCQFGLFISDLQYVCSFRDRRAVTNNLRKICPPGTDVSPLAREVFRNFGRYLIEFFQMNEMVDDRFIKKKVTLQGIKNLDDVLARGKGGIMITAHLGNWELGAVLLSVMGYSVMAVALPHKERPVNDLFNAQREAKGVTVVPTNGAMIQCIEQLRNNGLVALVADRDFSPNGIRMEFLGCQTLIPKGTAIFSLKTGAPIVPIFLIRNADGTFHLVCDEPIYPPLKTADILREDMLSGLIRRYLSAIEEKIRAYPSQWLMFREFGVSP